MPLQQDDIKVIRISPASIFTPQGTVLRITRVVFTIRDQGPFTIAIPQEQFSADLAHQQMREYATEIIRTLEI